MVLLFILGLFVVGWLDGLIFGWVGSRYKFKLAIAILNLLELTFGWLDFWMVGFLEGWTVGFLIFGWVGSRYKFKFAIAILNLLELTFGLLDY